MTEMNQRYLRVEMKRLRALLERHVWWLRARWGRQPVENYHAVAISDSLADVLLESGEDAEGEMEYQRTDERAAALGEAIRGLESEADELRPQSMMARLEAAFGLNEMERDLLLLALAPELDPSFEALFAYAQDNAQRIYPTGHLAAALFGIGPGGRRDVRRALAEDARLRRYGLVWPQQEPTQAVPQSARALKIDERIGEFLQGNDTIDARLERFARPMPLTELPQCHERLAAELAQRAGAGGVDRIVLTGPDDAGKAIVAREATSREGLTLLRLDADRLGPQGEERELLYSIAAREAKLASLAYYLRTPESDPHDRMAVPLFNDLLERLDAAVIVDSQERWPMERRSGIVPVVRPDRESQLTLWRRALGECGGALEAALLDIVEQFDLGPEGIARSSEMARQNAEARGAAAPRVQDLWLACRVQSGRRLEDMAQKLDPIHVWDDIVLPEDTGRQLREMAAQVAKRAMVYEKWGFARKVRRGRGIGALFSGPSGVGKTMAAEVLSSELELDLYRIDLAGVVSKYIGETEKNLRKIFDAAEQSGAILFFDEADALFGKRTEVKDSHDRYANIEVNYLLQRMEEYRGLAILATNKKSALDRAFLRRLRFLVDFPFPDAAHRKLIWMRSFPSEAPVDDLDFDFLARMEISGGNIRNIALNAAFLAAERGRAIGQDEILHAVRREYAKIDKLVTESEFGRHYERRR